MTCRDCGDDEPVYRVVPWAELTTWQQFRARWGGILKRDRSGVWLRDQYGDTYYDPEIGSPDYYGQ